MGREDIPAAHTGERRYAEHMLELARGIGLDAAVVGQGERLSVVAQATVSRAKDTVLVASHLDTVPVDSMEISPFDPRIEADRMFGRGTSDTKGGMAAALAALETVLGRGKLQRNVILVGEADEELGSVGVYDVLKHLKETLSDSVWGLATEPTNNRLVTHHKGVALAHVTARGRACHSSDPTQGDNAIYKLARAVLALEEHGEELRERLDPVLGPATLNPGIIAGGQAQNIVADRATLTVDRRLLPGETAESAAEGIRAALERHGVGDLELHCHREKAAIGIDPEAPAARACKEALAALGLNAEPMAVAFGTDAGLFEEGGVPSVVLGPGCISQAHTDRESIDLQELETATRFFERLFGG